LVAEDHQIKQLKRIPPVVDAQFDEIEFWIRTKLKRISIPLVVARPSRLILSFDIASMRAKSKPAKISGVKYGVLEDYRQFGWRRTLSSFT
jgi:hypothetical protein